MLGQSRVGVEGVTRRIPPVTMRWAVACAVTCVLAAGAPARAQTVTAEGSVGAGMFGTQPSSSMDLGIDLGGTDWAVGLGGRLRWLAGDGFRRADWDEASEIFGVLRYGLWRWQDDRGDAGVSLALGTLGGVVLGHGTILDGYAAGLDVDHGHVGAQVRGVSGRFAGELVVDDLMAPRIAGLRASMAPAPHVIVGAQLVGDRSAPDGVGPRMDGMTETSLFTAAGVDAELGGATADGDVGGAVYSDLVHLMGLGTGLHLGVRGELALGDGGGAGGAGEAIGDGAVADGGMTGESGEVWGGAVRLGARLELRAGTSGYLPGWIGPLYERDRRQMIDAAGDAMGGQLSAAHAGGMAGLGGLGGLTADVPGVGSAQVSYALRRGVSDLLTVRVAAPGRRVVQGSLWTAAELRGADSEALGVGAEVRARLPRHLFVAGEAARLYHDVGGAYRALWLAQVSVGTVLGEGGGRNE